MTARVILEGSRTIVVIQTNSESMKSGVFAGTMKHLHDHRDVDDDVAQVVSHSHSYSATKN